jgi:hypothetical protein
MWGGIVAASLLSPLACIKVNRPLFRCDARRSLLALLGRVYRASSCPLSGVFLPRSFIVGAAVDDPKRRFATIN